MITHREGFQKVYDLTENVLPGHVETTMPTPEQWHRFLVLRVVRGFGIATATNITTACRGVGQLVKQPLREGLLAAVAALVSEGRLEAVLCAGRTWYTVPGALEGRPV